ncbi:MAG TPA: GTP 3',8-cyclase MoaA [Clostridia bacterium]|nr:GTP 3',8-cyclase MoaA [Clostridia bacterium]
MEDNFHREVNYLRISVTEQCNLRCFYCRPSVDKTPVREQLTNRDLVRIVKAAAKAGINRVRLTGGEPLVRPGIVDLTRAINSISGIKEVSITTNGVLLPDYIVELKKAGLKRTNISLDTLKPDRYKKITRTGNLEDVWRGIECALAEGLDPVKINSVLIKGVNEDEICDLAQLSVDYPLHVRFIELMPIGEGAAMPCERMISAGETRAVLEGRYGPLLPGDNIAGSGPASYFKLPDARGTIGFIAALSHNFCQRCNRIRLTATGGLRPCLYKPEELDVAGLIARGASEDELIAQIKRTVAMKPERHHMEEGGTGENKLMSQIGG